MKTKYLGMLAAMAMLSLNACSNKEDLTQEPAAEGMPICFEVSTGDMQSRASHSKTDPIDNFAIWIQSTDKNDYHYIKQNYEYAYRNNLWEYQKTNNSFQPRWFGYPHTVNMIATSPKGLYEIEENPFEVTKDVEILTNQEQISTKYNSDVLISKTYNFDPSTLTYEHPAATLEFQHVMSQLQVEINFPEGTSTDIINTLKDITISGTNLKGTLTPSKEKEMVTATPGTEGIVTVTKFKVATDKPTASFDCILMPQTVPSGKLNVTFIYNGGKCKWVSNQEIILKENTIHKLQLTIKDVNATTQSLQSRSWGDTTGRYQIANSMN